MSPRPIEFFTIYHNPSDFPGLYVCRRFEVCNREVIVRELIAVERTLGEARRHVPPGCIHVGRMPEDDEPIVESWMR